jgi:uncharacterized protein (UPF0276 family)
MSTPQRAAIRRGRARVAAGPDGAARRTLGPAEVDFLEVAPENWIGVGGRLGQGVRRARRAPAGLLHGCRCRSAVSAARTFLQRVRDFKRRARAAALQRAPELLQRRTVTSTTCCRSRSPRRPCTTSRRASARCQDILGERIAVENASYYAAPAQQMRRGRVHLARSRAEADCGLLLDVNNIYVNSVNHRYDAREFLATRCPASARSVSTWPGITSRPRTCASIRMAPR